MGRSNSKGPRDLPHSPIRCQNTAKKEINKPSGILNPLPSKLLDLLHEIILPLPLRNLVPRDHGIQLSIDSSFFGTRSMRASGRTLPVETAAKSVGSSNASVATSFIEKLVMWCRKRKFS